MVNPHPDRSPYLICSLVAGLMQLYGLTAYAQAPVKDTAARQGKVILNDTIANTGHQLLRSKKAHLQNNLRDKRQAIKSLRADSPFPSKDSLIRLKDTLVADLKKPFRHLLKTKPALSFDGGYTSYYFNYRSAIDTPYAERNIMQHHVTGRLQVTAAGVLPLQISYWLRQSNSHIFRNIADVQVAFNGAAFRNRLQGAIRDRMLALAPSLKDSLTEQLLALKKLDLGNTDHLLQSFSLQSLLEANEILRVPRITYDPNLPDSTNSKREDSIKRVCALLLDTYAKTKRTYDSLSRQVDSLQNVYQKNINKIARYRQMVNGGWNNGLSVRDWKSKLSEFDLQDVEIPAKYRWLLGVRNFSLGRSVASYSELTAKNISVNGLNVEYNSWYYVGVSAGTVNYRFREFVVNGGNKKPQYMYLLRAGIGKLEKNYFILSYYRGRKQLFAASASRSAAITISGITAETRLQVHATTYLTAEVAKSFAPDFRDNPPQPASKFSLSDKTSQAIAIKLYSYLPATNSKVEAFYKHTGANFQSFTGFQTNAAVESWYIKAAQHFFHKKLQVTGSIRKNEFSNPFLVQAYKSNTIFKSLTASFRMRKWPVITIGYQPMSQLTVLDQQVMENRFHTLYGSLYYLYKIKDVRTASTLMLNKFYNTSADTGFIYYNATNIYGAQNFFFQGVTANIGVSHTQNPGYTLNVLDGSIQPDIPKLGTFGLGIKVNNLNTEITKIGGYVHANIRVGKQDMIYVSYEKGYLPGFNKGLVRNELASIQYTKYLK
jgi:hypothetical protein